MVGEYLFTVDDCVNYYKNTPMELDLATTARYLIDKYKIVTLLPEHSVLRYQDGIYIDNGIEIMRADLERNFGELKNNKHRNLLNKETKAEVIDKVESLTYTEHYKQLSPVKVPTFDSDLDIINMCNGLYNWRTGDFKRHTAEYKSRIQVAVNYDPEADCPRLMSIIRDVLDAKDVPKFLEFCAYCYYRSYIIQKGVIFFGEASTGKSQLLAMIANSIGKWNTTSVTFQDLGGRNIDRYATAKLYNKLVNIAGDMDATSVPEVGKFKMLTSGEDSIPARMIYGRPFEFYNFAKMVLSGNELPEVNDNSDGFYRRIEIFRTEKKFSASGGKYERLKALTDPEELSGLFNICIGMLPDLLERKEFTNPMKVEDVKHLYSKGSNPLEEFLNQCVADEDEEYISKEDFYNCYVDFCKNNKLAYIGSREGFGKELKKYWNNHPVQRKLYGGKRKECWMHVRVTV